MFEYFVVAIISLSFSLIKFKNRKAQLFCCFLPWFILIAGRENWTADYSNYELMFEERHDWDWEQYFYIALNTRFEPAFFALIKYLPSYRWLIIVQSFLLTCSVFFLFYKYIPPKTYPLALILWIFNSTFFESFAAIRSTFVVVLFIWASILKVEGKWKSAIILVLLSGLFHNSGWFLLPLVCVPTDCIYKRFKLFVSIIVLILFVALVDSSIYSSLLKNLMTDSDTLDYSQYIQEVSFGLGYYILTLFRIFIIGSLLYIVKNGLIPERYTYFILIAIIFYVMNSIPGIGLTYRINCYLRPFVLITLCYYYFIQKQINKQMLYPNIFIFLIVLEMLFGFTAFFNHPNYKLYFEIYNFAFDFGII